MNHIQDPPQKAATKSCAMLRELWVLDALPKIASNSPRDVSEIKPNELLVRLLKSVWVVKFESI